MFEICTKTALALAGAALLAAPTGLYAQKHSPTSAHPSYTGLVMTGYQGWFGTPGDGVTNKWRHYNSRAGFRPGAASIEYWPDMREAEEDEQYRTQFVFADGSPAYVFSSAHPKTVDRHFRWMREYGIDGAFVQRFRSDFGIRPVLTAVLSNALNAARAQGRAIGLMYDIGANIHVDGVPDNARRTQEVNRIFDDWKSLVDGLGLTTGGDDQPYLYHNGKPLVVLWGVGFNHRHNATGLDVQYWVELVDSLRHSPEYGGCSVMLGVPTHWRGGGRDCISGAEHDKMLELLKTVDIIQPWHTSRYTRGQMGTAFKDMVSGDLEWCAANGVDYTPTISPGIREKILHGNGFERHREGGLYFWDMARAAVQAGSRMLYLGMFDEIDEGTQYFKISNAPPFYSEALAFADYGREPADPAYDPAAPDAQDPEDHYLWLAGEAARALRGEFGMGPAFRERATGADFRSVVTPVDKGSSYEIELTTPAPGRRVFYAAPYAVPDGAPTAGTRRDPALFDRRLTGTAAFSEGQRGAYIRLVEVNDDDEVLAFKAVAAPARASGPAPGGPGPSEPGPSDILRGYNGSFENGLGYWRFFEVPDALGSTAEIVRDAAVDGDQAVRVTYAAPDGGLRDRALDNWDAHMELKPETGYLVKFWAKTDAPQNGELKFAYGFFNEDRDIVAEDGASFRLSDAYREYAHHFTAPAGTSTGWLAFRWKDGDSHAPGVLHFDHVQLWEGAEPTTHIRDRAGPDAFTLGQNRPNPFNPTTAIEFSLPAQSPVELTVFDALGQRVRTLLSGTLPAGPHRIEWDGQGPAAGHAASGVYFYRLQSNAGAQTRKMVLLR